MAERDPELKVGGNYPAYLDDYGAWLAAQLGFLREGRFAEIDMEHLVEEIEGLARSDFNGFVSAIRIVLLHMLKWDIQEDRRSRSWIASIDALREQMLDRLATSPSYHARLEEAVTRAYRQARVAAADQTGIPLRQFPEDCRYSWDEIASRPHAL